jgi:putative sterol carrier protein
MALVFDAVGRSVDRRRMPPGPLTIQWDFTDAQPWRLTIDNGASTVAAERVEHPDVTLRCRWEDWVDVAMGREDPRVALLKGKLRPRGNPRVLLRAPAMFGL